MNNSVRFVREYHNVSFRYTKGALDVFLNKQFHDNYEIYLLLNGKAEYINDHVRWCIMPYNLVIIPPGEYHRFVVTEEQTDVYERCVLNISSEFLDSEVL